MLEQGWGGAEGREQAVNAGTRRWRGQGQRGVDYGFNWERWGRAGRG